MGCPILPGGNFWNVANFTRRGCQSAASSFVASDVAVDEGMDKILRVLDGDEQQDQLERRHLAVLQRLLAHTFGSFSVEGKLQLPNLSRRECKNHWLIFLGLERECKKKFQFSGRSELFCHYGSMFAPNKCSNRACITVCLQCQAPNVVCPVKHEHSNLGPCQAQHMVCVCHRLRAAVCC